MIIDNLNSLYQFIKDDYVLKRKGIKLKFSIFHTAYAQYCVDKKITPQSKITVSKILARIGISTVAGTGNVAMIIISKDELFKIFKNKNWIHETDDIDIEVDDPIDGSPFDDVSFTYEDFEEELSIESSTEDNDDIDEELENVTSYVANIAKDIKSKS